MVGLERLARPLEASRSQVGETGPVVDVQNPNRFDFACPYRSQGAAIWSAALPLPVRPAVLD